MLGCGKLLASSWPAASLALAAPFMPAGGSFDTPGKASLDPSPRSQAQVGTFGEPRRDPRGWLVDVVYAGLAPAALRGAAAADDDAAALGWHDVAAVPALLAGDHRLVLRTALRRAGAGSVVLHHRPGEDIGFESAGTGREGVVDVLPDSVFLSEKGQHEYFWLLPLPQDHRDLAACPLPLPAGGLPRRTLCTTSQGCGSS